MPAPIASQWASRAPDGNRDSWPSPSLLGPLGGERPGEGVRLGVPPADLAPDAGEQRVQPGEELLGGQAARATRSTSTCAPSRRRCAALRRVGDPAERGGHHVAMFEGRDELGALLGVVAEPVQQLREPPLREVDAAAPVDRLEVFGSAPARDLPGLFLAR